MSGPFTKIITGALFFAAVCLLAVVGYAAHGWAIGDAIYMMVITIFGVGYGEVRPIESTQLRALTILVIVAGYASLIYTAGGFMQMLIDGELNKALGARRMNKEIDRLRDHTIVCGVGRLGEKLATALTEAGRPFVIIDSNPDRLAEASKAGYLVLQGDATEEETLSQAGVMHAKTLATVLSNDAANVFVTITARGMNERLTIVARGEDPRTEKKLIGSGANHVVLPTAIGANKVASLITRPSAEKMIEQLAHGGVNEELKSIGLEFDEMVVGPESPLVNRLISDINIRSNHGFLIVGIRRKDGTTELSPNSDSDLHEGDVVIVLGRKDDIPELERKITRESISYRGVKM